MDNTTTTILPKHRHLFIYYKYYIKTHPHEANIANKNYIYGQIGIPFYVNASTSARIIYDLLKKGYTPTEIDEEDFRLRFKDLKNVI